MSGRRRIVSKLAQRLQVLGSEIGKPFPALYLAAASRELLRAASTLASDTVKHAATHTALCSDSSAITNASILCNLQTAATVNASSLAGSCCIWRAAVFCSTMMGRLQADACSRALSLLLQKSPDHQHVQLLLQKHNSKHHHHYQHHHSLDNALRCLMLGRSMFALYKAEPSKEAWLSLLAALSTPKEPPKDQPHVLLSARRAWPRMQPRWVANRVTFQQPPSPYAGSRR